MKHMKRILREGEAGSSELWLNLQKIAEEESAVQTVSEEVVAGPPDRSYGRHESADHQEVVETVPGQTPTRSSADFFCAGVDKWLIQHQQPAF
jgi:hypothetical protein